MRINRPQIRTASPRGPLKTTGQPAVTFEGAPAFARDAKSDLFLLAVSNFYGEDSYYEKAETSPARSRGFLDNLTDMFGVPLTPKSPSTIGRNDRFRGLVQTVAAQDPAWTRGFIIWLRDKANIRTAAVVAAVEAAKVMLAADQPGSVVGPARQLLRDFFQIARPEEPAEAFAYWLATYGRKLPGGIRRGIGDGAVAKYNEYAFIKWNGGGKAVRMADVIEMCHPDPKAPWQSTLFKYILDSRRDPKTPIPAELQMLTKRAELLALPGAEKRAILTREDSEQVLRDAGMTWEQASSWGPMTAQVWESLIPVMAYGALLKNLRNFQEAGISKAATKLVIDRLSEQTAVLNSRQLPYRFLTAYLFAQGSQWAAPLETALQYSTGNIPSLLGRTLVLVDTSGSMIGRPLSAKSKIEAVKGAALFGAALAHKGEKVDLYGYDNTAWKHEFQKSGSVLRSVEEFNRKVRGGGTRTAAVLASTFQNHDRVVIVTDEQTFGPSRGAWQGDVGSQVPATVPVYSFNVAGYAPAMMDTTSTRHQLGGMTDHTFAMIPLIEAGQRAVWPWETASA